MTSGDGGIVSPPFVHLSVLNTTYYSHNLPYYNFFWTNPTPAECGRHTYPAAPYLFTGGPRRGSLARLFVQLFPLSEFDEFEASRVPASKPTRQKYQVWLRIKHFKSFPRLRGFWNGQKPQHIKQPQCMGF